MTVRANITAALQALLATDLFFPAAEIDAEEPSAWIAIEPSQPSGLTHAAAVHGCPPPSVTRDAGGESEWELRGEFVIAYAVQAAAKNRQAQRARRDAATEKVQALIAANRTLGLDVSVYAELGAPEEHNEPPVKGAANVCSVIIPIFVDYIAPSAAG